MDYSLIVVEGPQDAAFVGVLLKERGFKKTKLRNEVDPFWDPLMPKQFPANPQGRLDHVVKFPDIYTNKDPQQSVAVAAAGGSGLLAASHTPYPLVLAARRLLEALGGRRLTSFVLIL